MIVVATGIASGFAIASRKTHFIMGLFFTYLQIVLAFLKCKSYNNHTYKHKFIRDEE